MKKAIIAASAAMLFVSAAPAFAQAQKGEKPAAEKMEMEQGSMKLSAEDRAAFVAARIAALKAVLELTPEQEKHWDALAAVIKANAEERMEARAERREMRGERGQPIEMLNQIAKNMRDRADRLTKLADAAKPLFDSLTEAQKRRFSMMMHETFGLARERWSHMREMREMMNDTE